MGGEVLVASSFCLRRPFTPPMSPSPEVIIAFLNLAHSLARPVFAFSCTQNREQNMCKSTEQWEAQYSQYCLASVPSATSSLASQPYFSSCGMLTKVVY